MSNVHHIGDSAEPVNRPLSITPRHPLLVGATLKRADVRDVLNNCANTLVMLADLLGDADQTRFPTLDSGEARDVPATARRGEHLGSHREASRRERSDSMSDTNLNRFPSARSPLCAIPTNPADHASRTVCAIDTIRNACNLLDALACGLEDSEANGQWTLLNAAQWAIAHALQLLEERETLPATVE